MTVQFVGHVAVHFTENPCVHFYRDSPWTWRCNPDKEVIGGHSLQGRCIKELWTAGKEEAGSSSLNGLNGLDSNKQVGMMACKMTCNTYGMLWPLPTGQVELSQELIHLLPGTKKILIKE